MCTDRSARTELLFSCGSLLGTPVFEGESDCTFKFTWSSFVACNASSRPVASKTCKYRNPASKGPVDLKEMKTPYYSVESTPYVVHVARCGDVLGDELEGRRCTGKKVCV